MNRFLILLLLVLVALPVWGQTSAAIQVRIERVQDDLALLLDLSSAKPLNVKGIGFIRLSGEAGEFWAPFSFEHFRPISANTISERQLDGNHVKQRIDLSSLLWGRMTDALWPFRPFSIVPSGHYEASVVVEANNDRQIESSQLRLTLPAPKQDTSKANPTATTDPCRAKIPDFVAQRLTQRFPNHRLPIRTDTLPEDVEMNIKDGGDGCILVAIGDFNGDGRKDFAVGLAPQGHDGPTVGVMLSQGKGWRVSAVAPAGPEVERLFVATAPPGIHTRSKVLEKRLDANERPSLRCANAGLVVGRTESTEVVYCYVKKRWLFVVVSD